MYNKWSIVSSRRGQLHQYVYSCNGFNSHALHIAYMLQVHLRSAWNCHRQKISSAVHYCWCHTEVKWCHTLRGIWESHGQLGTGGDRCLLGISEYFRPLSLYYWRCFVQVYEIDISLPLVGVRRNRMTIRSVSSESTTVTLALYSMSRRSEGLSGQATRSALTFSYINRATL